MSKRDVRQIANIPRPAHDYSGAVERLFADMTDEDWLVHAEIHRALMHDGGLEINSFWVVDIFDSCDRQHGADRIGVGGRWGRVNNRCPPVCSHGSREEKVSVPGLDGLYGGHMQSATPPWLSFEAIEQDRPFTIGVDW